QPPRKVLVATIDVMDLPDLGDAFGAQAYDDQGGAGADVGGENGTSLELIDPAYHRVRTFHRDVGTHPGQFADVSESGVVHVLGDHGDTGSVAEEAVHLRLHVGVEARIWQCGDVNASRARCTLDAEPVLSTLHPATAVLQHPPLHAQMGRAA